MCCRRIDLRTPPFASVAHGDQILNSAACLQPQYLLQHGKIVPTASPNSYQDSTRQNAHCLTIATECCKAGLKCISEPTSFAALADKLERLDRTSVFTAHDRQCLAHNGDRQARILPDSTSPETFQTVLRSNSEVQKQSHNLTNPANMPHAQEPSRTSTFPKPMTASVLPTRETPVYSDLFHSPRLTEASAWATFLLRAQIRAMPCSAAATVLAVGALTTRQPYCTPNLFPQTQNKAVLMQMQQLQGAVTCCTCGDGACIDHKGTIPHTRPREVSDSIF